MSTVLVTGGTGFIAQHALLQLLAAGHTVRTTVRDPAREGEVRAVLTQAGADAAAIRSIEIFKADLAADAGWTQAVEGANYVLHVASPFPRRLPRDENELIVPAREGALRVLRAARDAGVKRVVMTSSFAAVGYGHPPQAAPFDETSWTDVNAPGVMPYTKSKTLAERAAWDFMAREGGGLELAVVNPVGVFGPVLSRDYATSILLVEKLMDGSMPGCPKLAFGAVDVRDVADLHLRAMTDPAAHGERFLATAGDFLTLAAMAQILKRRLGAAGKRIPTRELPNWLVRGVALFDKSVRQITPELGTEKNATSAKAQRLLAWKPRSAEEALVATAESLLHLGVV